MASLTLAILQAAAASKSCAPQSALYGSTQSAGLSPHRSGVFDGFGARIEGGSNNTVNGGALRINRRGVQRITLSRRGQHRYEPNARPIGGIAWTLAATYTLSGRSCGRR
jgi:hypothetical protein